MIVVGLSTSDMPSSAGNWLRDFTANRTAPFIISRGSRLKGKSCSTIALTRSLIVRMERSTSPTWSSVALIFIIAGATASRIHSNAPSA